ncbi:MAG: exodeoxyribonuclease VII small subunit [Deltaproteobacteria bacterium]|nr:exodeoxyribonuclease VII small subunit [Deltaproteobacteria bacterium]
MAGGNDRLPPAAPADDDAVDIADLGFEAALARLEAVVQRLERGELSLEESLSSYEQGVRLVAAARGKLEGLQGRLEELLADGTTRKLEKKPTEPAAGARS